MPGTALATIEETNARLLTLESRVVELEAKLEKNSATTDQIRKDTQELLTLFHTFTSAIHLGMKFTLSVGRLVQWIAGLIVAGGVLYTFYYNIRFSFTSTPKM